MEQRVFLIRSSLHEAHHEVIVYISKVQQFTKGRKENKSSTCKQGMDLMFSSHGSVIKGWKYKACYS